MAGVPALGLRAFRVAQVPVLVHDQHPEFVAGVQDFGVGRVVGRPPGVAADLFEPCNAIIFQTVRDGNADAREVLVVAHALNLDVLAVEEKTLVGVKTDRADAEWGIACIYDTPLLLYLRVQCVQLWLFKRPEQRVHDCHSLRDLLRHDEKPSCRCGDYLADRVF